MPMEVLSYNTLEGEATGEIVVKKSRFIANIFHVESEDETLSILERMRKQYWDARHNCYGYIIGKNKELVRFSDDGEPGGTAGKPILEVIKGRDLTDILVLVTRYFGGVLLGTGGLVRAYTDATIEGLSNANLVTVTYMQKLGIEVDYNIEVSFDGFIRMIDYLNGVELELTEAEADYLNKDTLYVQRTIEPGVQVLQGMEALSYARMRKAAGDGESDIKRTARQRNLVSALLKRFQGMSLSELNGWVDELLPMVTTTMTPSDVTRLAATILPMVSRLSMKGETVPVGKTGWGEMVDIYGDGTQHSVMQFVSSQQKQLIRAITEAEGN